MHIVVDVLARWKDLPHGRCTLIYRVQHVLHSPKDIDRPLKQAQGSISFGLCVFINGLYQLV